MLMMMTIFCWLRCKDLDFLVSGLWDYTSRFHGAAVHVRFESFVIRGVWIAT